MGGGDGGWVCKPNLVFSLKPKLNNFQNVNKNALSSYGRFLENSFYTRCNVAENEFVLQEMIQFMINIRGV